MRLRYFRIAALSIGGILIAGIAILHTPPAKRFALAELQRALLRRGIVFSATGFDYNLLSLRASLRDIVVTPKANMPPLLKLAAVDLDASVFDLIRGRLIIHNAALSKPEIYLLLDANGASNLPAPSGDSSNSILFQSLNIRDASLHLEDRQTGTSLFIPKWQLSARGNRLTGRHSIAASNLSPIDLRYAGQPYRVDRLQTTIDLGPDDAKINGLNIDGLGASLRVSGLVNHLSSPLLDLSAEASASLDRFTPAAGRASLQLRATGPLANLAIQGHAIGKDLAYGQYRDLNIDTGFGYQSDTATLRDARVASPYGNLTANAKLALKQGPSSLDARLDRIRLDVLKLPVTLATRATGDIAARWQALDWQRATSTAHLQLKATQGPAKDVVPLSGSLTARLQNGNGAVTITTLDSLGASLTGQLNIRQQQLSGNLSIAANNLSQTARGAATVFATKLPEIAGQATATLAVSGALTQPQANVHLAATPLTIGTLSIDSTGVNATYSSKLIDIRDSSINWKGQSLTTSGTIRDGRLDLKSQLTAASIEDLLAVFDRGDIPITGRIQANAIITGTIAKPSATAHLSAQDLIAYSQPLGELTADASLSPAQLIEVAYHLAKAPGEALDGQAAYNLDTQALEANLESTPLQIDRLNGPIVLSATTAGNDLQATIEAPKQHLTIQGHIASASPYAFEAEAQATDTDLATIPFETPATGLVSFTLKAAGLAADTKSIDATLLASRADLTIEGRSIKLDTPLDARLSSNIVTINSASISTPGASAKLSGTLPIDPAATTGSLNIDAIADLAQLDISATGRATVKGVLTGNLQAISPQLDIRVEDGAYPAGGLSGANLAATANSGAIQIDKLTATWANAAVTGSGSIPFGLLPPSIPIVRNATTVPAAFELALSNLDLAKLPGAPEDLAGKLSATLAATANAPLLDAIEGKLTVSQFNVDYNQVALEQDGPSTIRLAKGVATVEQLAIKGPQTQLALTGSAKLLGEPTVDAKLSGTTDIAVFALLSDELRARGPAQLDILAQGPIASPRLTGSLSLEKGEISLPSPRIAAENLNLRLDLGGNQLTLSKLTGDLNGGALNGSGSFSWSNGLLTGAGLNLVTKNVYLDFPANLKTVSDLEIKLAPVGDRTLLSGKANIKEGSFTDTVALEGGLFNIVNRSPELDLTNERNKFLSKLDYNVAVKTIEPIAVDNNLAKVEIEIDARLVGNYYNPGLTGRMDLAEGGELYLNERKYLVDRGAVTFVNEQKIEPVFDLLAKTTAAGYDITLGVQGSGRDRTTTLTSDPPLGEPDIAAVLLTGRTLDRLQGAETDVAKEQVLSYLTGRVGNTLGRGIQQATGISQVRIEPGLIANESDPSARLTVGQNLTRQLSLVYSVNLINSGDQLIVGQYDFDRRFRTRALKQSDNTYRFDFSRTQEFGGVAPPPRTTSEREKRTVGKVDIGDSKLFTDAQIRQWLNAREGKRYDFFQVRKGIDKIEKKYAGAGLLESRVRLKRTLHGQVVDVDVDITPGPTVDFIYEGYSPSRTVRNHVRDAWKAGVFDLQRIADTTVQIRKDLLSQRYVEAKIESKVDASDPDRKRVTFDVDRGMRFDSYKIIFAGATKIEEKNLRQLLRDQKLENDAIVAPKHVIDLISRYYQEQGYLDAKLAKPELILDRQARTAQSVFALAEGALYKVGKLDFEGNKAYTASELKKASILEEGYLYSPEFRQETVDNLRALYGRKGYNDAEVEYTLEKTLEPGKLRVIFRIAEGKQTMVDKIEISGTGTTSENFVKKQLDIKAGAPLDMQALTQSRRSLYQTGAFSLVEIDRSLLASGSNQAVNLKVNVRELRPFLFNYGGYFDTDRGPGGIVDLTNRNSLGMARVVGMRVRYDRDLQEGRLYFTQPYLREFPLRTTVSTYLRREVREGFKTDRLGFSLLQEARFRKVWLFNYGYRMENTHTYENGPDPLFDTKLRVAPFTSSISRDTRDDILDATKGQFTSHAVDYAPTWSGSELNYIKYFGQYFKYISLDKPRPLPMQKGIQKSRLVFATGIRVGLATGLNGQDLIPGRTSTGQVALGERFFAGGGTTVRGFAQDGIGPRLFDGISPAGGDAMIVLNNELRAPLYKIFDGVGFVDMGNIYAHTSDFRPWELRKAAGLGIRIRTPYFLIRFDYGIKLDRKPGEPLGRPFFSIGQAF